MKWTQAQQKTIETRGRNILVSAAAGSGKTTVMIERVKQLVLRDHIDIDRFLIGDPKAVHEFRLLTQSFH